MLQRRQPAIGLFWAKSVRHFCLTRHTVQESQPRMTDLLGYFLCTTDQCLFWRRPSPAVGNPAGDRRLQAVCCLNVCATGSRRWVAEQLT